MLLKLQQIEIPHLIKDRQANNSADRECSVELEVEDKSSHPNSVPSTRKPPEVDWSICYYALVSAEDLELSISYSKNLLDIIQPLEANSVPTRSYNLTAAEHRQSLLKLGGITCKQLFKNGKPAYSYSSRFKWTEIYFMNTINPKACKQYIVFWESSPKTVQNIEEIVEHEPHH